MATKKKTTKSNVQRVGKAKTKCVKTTHSNHKKKPQTLKCNKGAMSKQKIQVNRQRPEALWINKDGTITILYNE